MGDMPIKLNERQKEILKTLLNKYEKSKTYRGENAVNQSFQVKPSDFFKEYDSDFANLDEQDDFERELIALEDSGLVFLKRKNNIIKSINMEVSAHEMYYSLLGITELKELESSQIKMYESHLGENLLVDAFCYSQIQRIKDRKRAEYEEKDAREIIRILEFLCQNKEEILERELSIELFGDSKIFEKDYRRKILTILKKYGKYQDIIDNVPDERDLDHTLLAEHNVYPNPTYVYFKGFGRLKFKNGNTMEITPDISIALDSNTLNQIDKIDVISSRVVTVENLTSFNRVIDEDVFFIYLAGYHNSAKQTFIRKIAESNNDKEWFHFGDIDPDGFYILEHLKTKTAIEFKELYMTIEELNRYKDYCKPLEANDIRKAQSLIDKGLYVEEMNFMLNKNIKLEQEVISWKRFVVR